MDHAIVIPLKEFTRAKHRLRQRSTLDVTSLAEDLARAVLRASLPRPTYVATESESVAEFASAEGAKVLLTRADSLNEAVHSAYEQLGREFTQLTIVHGDLKSPIGLSSYVPRDGVTIFVDHLGHGTNVLSLPTGFDFHFSYGFDSAENHRREAERLGLKVRLERSSPWRFDIDEVDDL